MDEIIELWKKWCSARRWFKNREHELLRRGGDYKNILADDVLLGLSVGRRGFGFAEQYGVRERRVERSS